MKKKRKPPMAGVSKLLMLLRFLFAVNSQVLTSQPLRHQNGNFRIKGFCRFFRKVWELKGSLFLYFESLIDQYKKANSHNFLFLFILQILKGSCPKSKGSFFVICYLLFLLRIFFCAGDERLQKRR